MIGHLNLRSEAVSRAPEGGFGGRSRYRSESYSSAAISASYRRLPDAPRLSGGRVCLVSAESA